jgi:putative ABC transport system permease protein
VTAAILSALASHWRRNPLQLFTLLAGLALGTALWSGVQAINAEARASYDAAAATLGEGTLSTITARDGGPMSLADYVALRRAGWNVSPVIEGDLGNVRLAGIEPLTAPGGIGPVDLGQGGDLATFLSGAGQIFATEDTLVRLPQTGAQGVIAPDAAPGTAITDIGLAQRLLDRAGQIDRLLVTAVQPVTQRPLVEVGPHLVENPARGGSDVARLTDSFHLNLTAFGLLSFAVPGSCLGDVLLGPFERRRHALAKRLHDPLVTANKRQQ